ncbi:hypothetical protein MBLNU457_g0827t1 [Dothideomycetes sp. NU457]
MEVLIHTSAPSGRKDDQKFKRQAESYASLHPAKRIAIEDKPDTQHDDHRLPVSLYPIVDINDASAQSSYQAPSFIDDTQLAVSALESQLLTESLKRRISRSARHVQYDEIVEAPVDHEGSSAEVETPSRPPRTESYIAQRNEETPRHEETPCHESTLHDDESLHDYADPTPAPRPLDSPYVPVREGTGLGIGYVGTSETREPHGTSQVSQTGDHLTATPQFTRRTHSSSWTGDDVPSQLPSSYSLSSENTSKASVPGAFGGQLAPVAETENRVTEDIHHEAPPPVVGQETNFTAKSAFVPTPEARSVTRRQEGPPPSVPLPRNQPSPPPPIPQSTPARPPSPATLQALISLPLSIHPPAPPTSLAPFKTHVTPALASLLAHPDISTKYDPHIQTRPVLLSERGFWSLDTRSLRAAHALEFWDFLTKFVGRGSAGFGVWATRGGDEVRTVGSGSSAEVDEIQHEGVATKGLGTVRVFCWGEVVPHVYLLLYVASKSRIKKIGAQWLDAGGEVVVQMPTR